MENCVRKYRMTVFVNKLVDAARPTIADVFKVSTGQASVFINGDHTSTAESDLIMYMCRVGIQDFDLPR